MLTTPAEAIKKISEWYKTDMNQPIMLLVDDVDELYNTMFSDVGRNGYIGLYKSVNDIPKEIIEGCFYGVSNDDRVWDSIRDSYAFDIDQIIDKQVEAEKQIQDDEPLWD